MAEPIAVLGLACRVPGARDIDRFWCNLLEGRSSIEALSDDRLAALGRGDFAGDPDFVNAGTAVPDVAAFDHAYFGYGRDEAMLIDPQQRLFLEECVRALDHANRPPALLRALCGSRVGVFASCRRSSYEALLPRFAAEETSDPLAFAVLAGTDKDYLATRVAYKLGLSGPALSVQTACSSSLVAIHLACRSLQSGECDLALAGGVGISLPQGVGYRRRDGSVFAKDGVCRPFGRDGSGIVTGNGLAVVVLARLADVVASGDVVHAVILGSAVGNDGAERVGFAAPGLAGQRRVIEAALASAGVSAREIGLVEAHGTGTPLGDSIEVAALAAAFRRDTAARGFCGLGSVKGNVGHLDTAAGVVSFAKAVLAVRDGVRPPTLFCRPVNPWLDLDASPFVLVEAAAAWEADGGRRIAGVSSFGVGGTNCHVVVAGPPPCNDEMEPAGRTVIALSAHSETSLAALIAATAPVLDDRMLARQARTLALRRSPRPWRIAVAAATAAEARTALAGTPPRRAAAPSRIALLVPHDPEPGDAALSRRVALGGRLAAWQVTPVAIAGVGTGVFAAAVLAGAADLADASARSQADRSGVGPDGWPAREGDVPLFGDAASLCAHDPDLVIVLGEADDRRDADLRATLSGADVFVCAGDDAGLTDLVAALFRHGVDAPLRALHAARPGPWASLPPTVFDATEVWPDAGAPTSRGDPAETCADVAADPVASDDLAAQMEEGVL
ncbi:beta-ketoacyl synthase N-terminal-like domain-containing protein [Rhodoplanes sp. TEM]|uniref:Beta-ketoacyl synthase N-terminal-like domain-containing protein n=1 Tax=Rhodoplanes tepidamans TaxID=200616 RepID=A0ABT5JEX7_RHOTP|nr:MULTISPECIES: polyketide synthase [Rhodoplanes]MDC7788186.1 beta-ketoacyl synthase N-terminal-like domain-containing protein [Rhodoplanes tepidamans]MDC7987717.1 beta-ketoacyl synthase N-terminal-like domain-containing protein [Rhodoplanes sp. TEM]MDQ0354230.1 acyl transferase domain-containing protein [Rhodoplanes tepidamans]